MAVAAGVAIAKKREADRRTVRAAGAMVFAGIVVKLAAACKESAVAGFYGRSDAMDAFLAAMLIPNLLINFIAESMNQALIPTLIRVRLREGRDSAQRLLSSSLGAVCVLLAGAALSTAILARTLFPLIASNFSQPKLELAVHLFYLVLPGVVFGGIASNCTAVLNASGRFTLPALAPAVIPMTIVAGAIAFHAAIGIWAMAVATLLGMAVHAGWMAMCMGSSGYSFRLRWHGWNEPMGEVARQYGPAMLGALVASGGLLVDQSMAAMLPAGSISALVFAGRFVGVAISLLAGAISTVLTPFLSELAALHDWRGCRLALRSWAARAAILSVPVALALASGSRLLVRIVLQHGRFGPKDTGVVATVLLMYALQIPFFSVSRVPYRLIVALRRTDLVFYCGGINLALDVVLNLILMRRMGVAGIALATSLWTVSTCALLWYWALRLLRNAERDEIPRSALV